MYSGMALDTTVITLPHLPAPTAVHDPLSGHAARAARTAAQRIAAQEQLVAHRNNRFLREPLHSESDDPVERSADEGKTKASAYRDSLDVVSQGTTNLFFVQRYAQEEVPLSRPSVAHETAASAYPSLDFEDDILLPGEAVPLGWSSAPRLDIIV